MVFMGSVEITQKLASTRDYSVGDLNIFLRKLQFCVIFRNGNEIYSEIQVIIIDWYKGNTYLCFVSYWFVGLIHDSRVDIIVRSKFYISNLLSDSCEQLCSNLTCRNVFQLLFPAHDSTQAQIGVVIGN